jgi:hypothetical protein
MTYIEVFVLLQVLDFLTTLVGMRLGGTELSPFIRWLMNFHPVWALVAVKVLGFGLAAVCLMTGRSRVLFRINYFFAALVTWNLCNILVAVSPPEWRIALLPQF